MSSNILPKVIINNPLIFMTKEYLEKTFLKDKFTKGEIIPIIKNEIPKIILIKFGEESLIDQFINEYNDKPLLEEFNYKLSLTKTTKDEDEIKQINNLDNS